MSQMKIESSNCFMKYWRHIFITIFIALGNIFFLIIYFEFEKKTPNILYPILTFFVSYNINTNIVPKLLKYTIHLKIKKYLSSLFYLFTIFAVNIIFIFYKVDNLSYYSVFNACIFMIYIIFNKKYL